MYISKYSSRALSEHESGRNVVAAKARAFDILSGHLGIDETMISRWRLQSEEVPTHGLAVEELLDAASMMPSVEFARASLKVRIYTQ